jgi:glucose-6-phosphate isomerase
VTQFYTQDIDGCLAVRVGGAGLDEAKLKSLTAGTAGALEALRKAHDGNSLPLLRLPATSADLDAVEGTAARMIEAFDDVIVLGTGGSSLGGRTLCALARPSKDNPRLHFLDNVDGDTFERLFAAIDPKRTGFIVISKSGSTAETLSQMFHCLDVFEKAIGKDGIAKAFVAVTEPGDNVLRRIAKHWGMETLDHDPKIGGRYSALSIVGLLPTMIAGLDAHAVREGAKSVLDPVLAGAAPDTIAPCVGAALSIGLAHQGVNMSVLMPYVDRLADFGLWYRQLWAESIGKDGQGTTPIRAMGTVDQHSQLQLYLDGPRDKLFSVVFSKCAGTGGLVPKAMADDPSLAYLAGRTLGDLLDAEQRATAETLIKRGCPTRIFRLDQVNEQALGALMMHYMIETIVAAHLMGVDPFDQPAVEEGKVLARKYLQESAQGKNKG